MMTTLLYILLTITFLLIVWVTILEIRIRRFTKGSDGKNLEKKIHYILDQIEKIYTDHALLKEEQTLLKNKQKKAIRNIETIRFNPFKDQGGIQSFAAAFINDEKNGIVISSLYARDRMSIFAKPIIDGKSEYELTVEEKTVLDKSI